MFKELQEKVWMQIEAYQQQLKKYYDKKVRPRAFKVRELVLRHVMQRNQEQRVAKLGPI